MKIFVFCACSFLCVQRKKFSVRHENQHKSSECCSFFHSNRNERRNEKNACIFLLALHIFVCVSFICRCVCVREFVRSSFVWSVCCFFFLFNFVQSCCTIWLYYFCSAHNLLDVAAAAFGKYYVEVIERQRPKLWLAKVTDRQTDGRTDKRAYRLTKLTWLSC